MKLTQGIRTLRVGGRGILLSYWFPTVFLGTLGYREEQQEHLSLLAPPWLAVVSQWTEATWCLTTEGLTHGWAERALGVLFIAWHAYLRIHVCWITGSNEAWIWGKPQFLQLPWVADEKLGPGVHSSRISYTQFLGREDSYFVYVALWIEGKWLPATKSCWTQAPPISLLIDTVGGCSAEERKGTNASCIITVVKPLVIKTATSTSGLVSLGCGREAVGFSSGWPRLSFPAPSILDYA